MKWTGKAKRPDVVRAVIGIVVVALLLSLLTGCAVDRGPRMMLGVSGSADGFIRLTQDVYEKDTVTCFVEYEHHSEIFKEYDEDVGDFAILGCSKQFGKWKWQR